MEHLTTPQDNASPARARWSDMLEVLCECMEQAVPCCASEHWRMEAVLDRGFHRDVERRQ